MSVDRARDAVVHLGVQLGKDVSCPTRTIEPSSRQNQEGVLPMNQIWTTRVLPSWTHASWTSLMAACSTMFLTWNLLMALSCEGHPPGRQEPRTNQKTFHRARSRKARKPSRSRPFTHLGAALGAVGAADVLDMAAAVLVAAAVAALEGLRTDSR